MQDDMRPETTNMDRRFDRIDEQLKRLDGIKKSLINLIDHEMCLTFLSRAPSINQEGRPARSA